MKDKWAPNNVNGAAEVLSLFEWVASGFVKKVKRLIARGSENVFNDDQVALSIIFLFMNLKLSQYPIILLNYRKQVWCLVHYLNCLPTTVL